MSRAVLWYYSLVRPRWRKVLSDFWGNKLRSLMVILSIAVGVFAVGMISTILVLLDDDMRSSYSAIKPANVVMNALPFHPDFVETIQGLEGIQDAQGAWIFRARVNSGAGKWSSLGLRAIYNIDQMGMNRLQVLEGTWPPGRHQIVLEQYRQSQTNAKIGDFIEIKLPSGRTRQLQVVGVVQDQTLGAGDPGGFFSAPPQGFISFDTLPWLEQPEMLNHLYVHVAGDSNDEKNIETAASRIQKKFDQIHTRVLSTIVLRSIDHPNSVYIEAISGFLIILGLLIVFLSTFLITNTLTGLINHQAPQIGVLKTIGARRSQIVGIYLALIAAFSTVALGVALPLSGQAAFFLLGFLGRFINFIPQGFRIVPLANIAQIIIAFLVPQIAGIIPILRGSLISVQDAANRTGIQTTSHHTWLDRLVGLIRDLPRPLLLSLRNTVRSKPRLALTLATLVLGGAVFIATINVRTSLNQYIGTLSRYYSADVSLTLDRAYPSKEMEGVIRQVPGVTVVEGWAGAQGILSLPDGRPGEPVQIQAPPPDSQLISPILLEGRWIQPGDQNKIVVNDRFLSSFPELKVGDTLHIKIDGEEKDWQVVGTFQFFGKSGDFIAYANYDYLSKLIHTPLKATTFRIQGRPSDRSQTGQKLLAQQIEAHLQRLGYKIVDSNTGLHLLEYASNGLNVLTAFLLMMAGLTAVVGSIGLTGTMSMNVIDRVREIGVMRAIGASNQAIMRLVIIEGLIIGAISWFLGSLLAFPISKVMADVVSFSLFNSPASFSFSPASFLLWFGVVLMLSIVSSVLPAHDAARLTIREVLAYE